ncbi:hypothetical protein A2U01_0110001, partial [Trifolium medium]|nr:hypothetical protein [Trifolium medium]
QTTLRVAPAPCVRCAASRRKSKNAGQQGALRSTAERVAPGPATSAENAILSKEDIK